MHHAYLVTGTMGELLEHLGEDAHGYDFWRGEFATFGIDESRDLKERAGRKAATEGGKKIFVISAHTFTLEAQNALLKLFEDPVSDTHFFILTPSAQHLIPTLKSRLFDLAPAVAQRKEGESEKKIAKEFLNASYPLRIAFAVKIAKEEGAKQTALEIIECILLHIRERNAVPKREDAEILEKLSRYRDYLFGRSPSVKMILESAAIMLH